MCNQLRHLVGCDFDERLIVDNAINVLAEIHQIVQKSLATVVVQFRHDRLEVLDVGRLRQIVVVLVLEQATPIVQHLGNHIIVQHHHYLVRAHHVRLMLFVALVPAHSHVLVGDGLHFGFGGKSLFAGDKFHAESNLCEKRFIIVLFK